MIKLGLAAITKFTLRPRIFLTIAEHTACLTAFLVRFGWRV